MIFIESAALYTYVAFTSLLFQLYPTHARSHHSAWTLFFLVSYSSNSLLEAFAFHCIPAATGISFMLIIVRVGLGFHWSPASGSGIGTRASTRKQPARPEEGYPPVRMISLNVTRTVERETDFALRRVPEKNETDAGSLPDFKPFEEV